MIKVLKFGGTSVGSAANMRRVADIIVREGASVTVLSAMSGTTDTLQRIASFAAAGGCEEEIALLLAGLKRKYVRCAGELLSDGYADASAAVERTMERVAAEAVYGMWQHFGLPLLPLVFALPVFYLAVVSLVPTKWHGSFMSLGLLMSAAGDYCGESGMFLLQASFFAVAHIFYAVYFLRGAWFRPSSLAAALLLCAAVAVAASRIIPAVGNPTEHGAVVVYAVLITLMCASSFFWKGKGRGWYIAGALLFLISDVFLAWNRFVRPFTWSSVAVLSCYWAAQALLAGSYLARFIRRPLFR